jgi:hypothetical protein
MEVLNEKTDVQVIRLRRADGSEEKVHLFLDKQGFLTGANNLQALAGWTRGGSVANMIPGLKRVANPAGGFQLVATPAMQGNLKFFQEGYQCDFPGCEALLEEYKNDLTNLATDPNCLSGCEKSKLTLKYLKRLSDLKDGLHPTNP